MRRPSVTGGTTGVLPGATRAERAASAPRNRPSVPRRTSLPPVESRPPTPTATLPRPAAARKPKTVLAVLALALAAVTLALLATTLTPAPAAGQGVMQEPLPDRPVPPPFYAIQNARIVTGTGQSIESGRVVIAEGLITAVGPDAQIPPEAWVIDGEGLTVYPGLFDAMSDLGLRGGGGDGDDGGGGGGGSPFQGASNRDVATGPEDRPATYPWRAAADRLNEDDGRISDWREGGFTTAMVAPDEGMVAGQGAVIALAGGPEDMVVATPAALNLNLSSPGGFRSYPSSLFGVLSYFEQLFDDADRWARAMAAYRQSPRGTERPRYDRTLEPIHRAVTEGWPVLIPADDAKEIRRGIQLGSTLGVNTVLVGGQGAWRNASEVAAAAVPVLVDVDWPERTRDADPEGEESLRSMMNRANAPTTPAALEAAGATWAFYSGSASSPSQVLEGVRTAIEKGGLSEEAALAGLTNGPATIFGVADRTGTVETGKIANLVVTDGPLFEEGTKVKMTFVDGNKFEIREEERPEEPPAADMGGTWTLTVESPQGEQEATAELTMAEDGTLSGTLTGPRGEQTISDGWVSGNQFRFTATMQMGPRSIEVSYTGTFEGEEIEGTASAGNFSMEFTGERTSPPEGGGGGR